MTRIVKVDFSSPSIHRDHVMRSRWKKRARWLRHLKNANLKRLYGITLEQYEQLLKSQKGFCAICRGRQSNKQNRSLDVDHEKDTGKIRGLLCNHCNRGLAFFRHDTKLLSAAIKYLFACAEEFNLKEK